MKGIRRPGGGRPSALETMNGIDAAFFKVIAEHTAGSPTDETVKWTNLTRTEIAKLLELEGFKVSVTIVDQLLEKHNYRKRKAMKRLATGSHPQRNAQFENIEVLKAKYTAKGNRVLRNENKKKELIGQLYRQGHLYTDSEPIEVYDLDLPDLATGVAIPHGLYDLKLNVGYLHIGISHDTSEFACDGISDWWQQYGSQQYSNATSILLLCDGGGSNSARQYLFKQDLQLG